MFSLYINMCWNYYPNGNPKPAEFPLKITLFYSEQESMKDNLSINQFMYQKDPNFTKYRLCFKNSLRELDQLLKDISTKPSTLSNANNLTLIHGYLLIILEIVKFAGFEFEKQLEQYLYKYNLYHQNKQGANKNNYYLNSQGTAANQTTGSTLLNNNSK